MSARSASRRYAAVLFEVVQKSGDLAKVETELNAFVALLDSHAELQAVLGDPAVAAPAKHAILEQILNTVTGLSGEVRRLVLMLADRGRMGIVRDVASAYGARLMVHRNIVQARITTATPLPDSKRDALAKALSVAASADVRLQEDLDPAIMGGIIARVGSVVYDASLTRQLEKMRQQLLAQM